MGGEIPTAYLGDLLSNDRGISVGVMYPGDHDPLGVPLIKAGDLAGGRIDRNITFRISREVHQQYRRTELVGGELLMTLVGDIGRCAVVPSSMAGWNAARAIAVMRFRNPGDAIYVRICLQSPRIRHLMDVWSNTTVQQTLNLKEIKLLPLPWPDANERARIAHILGTLDDKIELNRRTNETLEAMARALFKSWFVDFDPVRAKAAGRQPAGMDAETAALFPSEFVESETGESPKGWSKGPVYELANVDYGAPYASSHFKDSPPGRRVIRIRDLLTQAPTVWTEEEHPRDVVVQPGDVLVGMDGEFRARVWGGEPAVLNQRCCRFRPRLPRDATFLRLCIEPALKFVEDTEVATTVIHLGKSDIDSFQVLVPHRSVLDAFWLATGSLGQRWLILNAEARSLAALRDTLLPRLLSGELRIPDAERFVGTAT